MLYPPVADLLKNVDSRYLLVNVVAHRARQIAAEAEALQEELPENVRECLQQARRATADFEYEKAIATLRDFAAQYE